MQPTRSLLVLSLAAAVAFAAQAKTPPPPVPVKTIPPHKLIAVRSGTKLARLMLEVAPRVESVRTMHPRFRLDIPDWLRAHYSRHHVEMRAAARANDPTGGLPLALENLYVWMLHHQDFLPTPPSPPSLPRLLAATVSQNVSISGDQTTPKSESDIRARIENPNQIIGASNRPADGNQAQFYSQDGGKTWGQTFLPLLQSDSMQSDPTVDWTSDGTAWTTTIGISADTTVLQMRDYRSSDGGKTWVFDATFSGEQTNADKQMTWVDHSPTSPYRDTLYVIWHDNAPAFVNRRTSGGWQAPLAVSGAETTGTAIGADITTNAAGDVYGVWPDTGSQGLYLVKSVNGGASYTAPSEAVKTFGAFQVRVPAFAERGALIGVSIAAFKDATHDNLYIAYVDLSGDPGCTVPDAEPQGVATSTCKSRIWVAVSQDGGKTFGPPSKINDSAALNDQFNHRLAVDPQTGVLGIVYYDTLDDPNRLKTNVVFQASGDGGGTWSAPLTVSSAMSDETSGSADQGNQYGDYNGLTVAGGVFHPCWTDRRANVAEGIDTASISVSVDPTGRAVPAVAHPTPHVLLPHPLLPRPASPSARP